MTGKLIGIVGYVGSGKTSLTAAALVGWNSPRNCVHVGFSDTMTRMFLAMGVPAEIINDKARWNDPLDILCGHSLRYAYTTLGTEWGREYIGEDIWTNLTVADANERRKTGKNVIIDNVRFPSEFDAIVKAGGICVALIRPGLEPDLTHKSEQHIEALQWKCARAVKNSGTFADGVEALRVVLCDVTGSIHHETTVDVGADNRAYRRSG